MPCRRDSDDSRIAVSRERLEAPMAHIERTTLIEAPIADVFEYATIIPKLTEWWPSLMDVRKYTQERMATGVRYE